MSVVDLALARVTVQAPSFRAFLKPFYMLTLYQIQQGGESSATFILDFLLASRLSRPPPFEPTFFYRPDLISTEVNLYYEV